MSEWTRREVLTSAIALPAASALRVSGAPAAPTASAQQPPTPPAGSGAGRRERLLLDFGWRFHFGHAHDPKKDLGYGGSSAGFQKTGNFLAPSHPAFDDNDWTLVDLPHDWAIGLPFTTTSASR